MGLGLHGGGSASARFFAESGAIVTVTDLRSREVLEPSLRALSDLSINYVLEKHNESDFRNADIIIKNPAVRPDSPYLKAALEGGAEIETDISTFLKLNKRPVIAVTGSKGKSTTVSALYHVLSRLYPDTDLGGNITVSPLTFYSEAKNEGGSPVILELSSWQLADIAGRNLLKPAAAAVTNIMHDHQDRYSSMDDYAADKAVIFESQQTDMPLLLNAGSEYTKEFAASAPSRVFYLQEETACMTYAQDGAVLRADGSGYWSEGGARTDILGTGNLIRGSHNGMNLLTAAGILYKFGTAPEDIISGLADFPGIAHRLEYIRNFAGIDWYNDSAATIPEAAAAAVESFSEALHLISGGTDKDLDFTPLADAVKKCPPASISLLKGTATDKITALFNRLGIDYDGPFSDLTAAVNNVLNRSKSVAEKNGQVTGHQAAVLSPGSSSFGMFKNEFDRGDQFRELVKSLSN
ncbi:MAG: UDP-N-acetylmuramoyl-L-alanine--D-glutamate ligase [Spirochaetales bacterium]|uniref:UDP-N-acetylmuramoyl-L-alanine--D-glutamate ligase n=1 Tax=Candidatus Thalassospirochaeta sargassi TaxID=3119039 RepID=A0AAJ1IFM3_9SPIO|nr:UDP-N-acetylmuramoyl-L-alanine--D-glutamate ligase [Spirochaetales bacterium]